SEGGITFAQSENSAKFSGMPRSAIAAGVVDFVLSPEDIAKELVRISRHPYVTSHADAATVTPFDQGDDIDKLFKMLRAQTGSDFSAYKRPAIERRVHRRMALEGIAKLSDYIKFLRENPAAVKTLYEDLLINVTGFFRDPKIFEALKDEIFPELLKDRPSETPIRIWVAGCSTGEEVYSIAMLLVDFLVDRRADHPVQIFGTDISETAVRKARSGLYSDSVVANVSQDLFQRYFTKVEHGYRISKRIRELCVFSRQ